MEPRDPYFAARFLGLPSIERLRLARFAEVINLSFVGPAAVAILAPCQFSGTAEVSVSFKEKS